ncbi:MAG: putative hydroxymethylpyrimidine transport system ATP-binding protein [Clostridia bacterium]|nr:putative hydroxymethylpyrimidine transport system ATP-binding protein [Clostridia bacterium]MDN5321606.1 putative hydroxymethylpyrimidine transport system ATP-binding protein [Clostridia bacterium]
MVATLLEAKNISYGYEGMSQLIFDGLSFTVQDGEFVTLVGPSGCGKTTLLHILAGLITDFSGNILLDGMEVERLGKISLMPQQDLLLPWRTVLENGSLPLEIKGLTKMDAQKQARQILIQFGLAGFENVYPHQLSGGMRQRVAFLRSILTGNKIFLLDEPFSALDALTRLKMQEWLLNMWQKFKPTIIFITHDVEEAVFLAQRVFLLSPPPNKKIIEYPVPFFYPRSRSLLGNENFVKLRQEILAGLSTGE